MTRSAILALLAASVLVLGGGCFKGQSQGVQPATAKGAKTLASTDTKLPDEVVDPESQIKGMFPPNRSIPGWRLSGDIAVFDEDNLFEHIDGAAEAFFAYGFQLCGTAEYDAIRDSDNAEASAEDEFIVVDIYDMERPVQAFGMYASESYPEATPVNVGAQGYADGSVLNFWKGKYYVKITASSEESDVLKTVMDIAVHIATKIPGKAELPRIISLLPRWNMVAGSERYLLDDILGYAFLKNGVTAKYRVDGDELVLFVIDCRSAEKATEVFARFAQYEQKSGDGFTRMPAPGDEAFAADDKYYGHVFVARHGRYLLIAASASGEANEKELVKKALDHISS